MTRTILSAVCLAAAILCSLDVAHAQCTEAKKGSVTLYMFDLTSPDLPQDKLHRFLDILTFKLNTGIRDDLKSRGLLGKSEVEVLWCSGDQIQAQEKAVIRGRELGSAGVMWGSIDGGSGRLKSALRLTAMADKPITGLSNIIYGQQQRELVDGSYLAFAAYLLGKQYIRSGNTTLAKRSLTYARDLKGLPDALSNDLQQTLTAIEQSNPSSKLAPVGRTAK